MRYAAALIVLLARLADIKVGGEVPDINFKSVCGKELKLSELNKEDKIVLVVSWSLECGSTAVSRVDEIAKKYGDNKRVVVIGVSAYGDTADKILEYLKKNDLKYPVMHDADKSVSKTLGAKRVNMAYVVSGGRLFYRGAVMRNGKDKVVDAIEAALEGKPAPKSDQDKAG